MTLYSWIRNYVQKYTFVKKTIFTGAYFYIYYMKDGKEKYKKLPYRTSRNQLISTIEAIKKDINYYEKKNKDIKEGKYKPKQQEAILAHN